MEKRPEFTVVAGPNGAGKSRLSPFYIPCKAFDGDKLAMQLRKKHPDWPERWIDGTVASELEKQKNQALEEHTDFAFETNFSSEMVVNMVKEFKEAGFKVTLYYFGLLTEDESVARVIQRSMTGGHDVPEDVIRYNFNEGLKKVQDNLNLFENITFIDGNSNYGRIIAMHITKNNTHRIADELPAWYEQQFRGSFDKVLHERAKKAAENMRAKTQDMPDMSLDEINEEIRKARLARKQG